MILLERSQTYNASNPKLAFFCQTDGWLSDLYSLEFQVFDVSDETKQATPSQVYPVTAGTRATVDVAVAGRLGTGRYAATWAVGAAEPEGAHIVRWFWKKLSTDTEQRVDVPCEIVASNVPSNAPMYCGVSDIRAEGIAASEVSTVRVLTTIARMSRYIEQTTQQFFEPRYMTFRESGRGTQALHLSQVVIGAEQIEFPYSIIRIPVDTTAYVVYNRHLEGLLSPDDRQCPKIEVFYGRTEILIGLGNFSSGKLNVKVTGVFGYTEFDGSPFGRTPELLRRACVMLVLRDIKRLTDASREDSTKGYRITSQNTRDQGYSMGGLGEAGGARLRGFTGDPEIDSLLACFVRPVSMGAA